MTEMKAPPDARPRFGLATEGTLRAAPIVPVRGLLRNAGLDPDALLAEAGLSPDALDDPENLLPAKAVGRVLELAADRSGWEDFAAQVGAMGGLHTLGIIGELARNARSVGEALRSIDINLHLHDRLGALRFKVEGPRAFLGYASYHVGMPGTAHLNMGALALAASVVRELCGEGFTASEVRLACRPPRDLSLLRRHFRATLRFNADEPMLVFPSFWLARSLPSADPERLQMLEGVIARIAMSSDATLRDRLKRVLRIVLVHESGRKDDIAARFSLHRRTLNRRLQELGVTFHQLVEESRFEIARQLLNDTDMTALEIATALGYADASAFTRAFRRWTGSAPQAWRTRTPARPIDAAATAVAPAA